MKLTIEQLATQLDKPLTALCLITGEEPLLMQEASDAIKQAAYQQGFTERQWFSIQSGFDWQQLHDSIHNLSLFSEKKLIILSLKKFTKEIQQFIDDYESNSDTRLLIRCEKLDGNQKKSTAIKKIHEQGMLVEVKAPLPYQFSDWLQKRLQLSGFDGEPALLQYLSECSQGNLVAAQQYIDKLTLLCEPGVLRLDQLSDAIHDQARFDVFTLANSLITGSSKQTLNILQNLQAQRTEPTLILWAYAREIRLLLALHEDGRAPIWQRRQMDYQRRLRQLKPAKLYRLLQQAHQLDKMIKGLATGNIWDGFASLAVALCGSSRA